MRGYLLAILCCGERVPLPEAQPLPVQGRMVIYGTLDAFLVAKEEPWQSRVIWTTKTLDDKAKACAVQLHSEGTFALLVEGSNAEEARKYISTASPGPYQELPLPCPP